jgi:hypothetical protein
VIKDNQNKFIALRKKFTTFFYDSFVSKDFKEHIDICYNFQLGDHIKFFPEIRIQKNKYFNELSKNGGFELFIFNIGLIELISYWKAACPPRIIVKPFHLDNGQINFLKKIYFNGLGEFFFTNGIHTTIKDFVTIESVTDEQPIISSITLNNRQVIVPVGGGKDSVVTLELLKKHFKVLPFVMNPREASLATIEASGYRKDEILIIYRHIHPQLLDLNTKGFLNGHTPFSALIGFATVMMAALTGSKYIALSNESSANEPTIASGENHQYSKSFEFEKDFRDYVSHNLNDQIEYFSFLRPLSEYQIAKLFSGFEQHHHVFRSCNVGSKTDSWCCKCPKCLFTNIILAPFLTKEKRVQIFGTDLFNDPELLDLLKELSGISPDKPFECVGTVEEVNLALYQAIESSSGELPFLLKYYKSTRLYQNFRKFDAISKLTQHDPAHFLNPEFYRLLKSAIDEG